VAQVKALRAALERMPPQLYVQCVLMSELVATAIEDNLMYFAQRRPRELGKFEWTVDAKDPVRVSPQEAWWRDTLAPSFSAIRLRHIIIANVGDYGPLIRVPGSSFLPSPIF
jgi:hypothetical protein